MHVLVTGGCGFIGSHQAVALLESGHDVTIVDDLSNSSAAVLERITKITGRSATFVETNVRDTQAVTAVMSEAQVDSIIHFAAFKHVRESMERPVDYFANNIEGLTSVLHAATESGVRRMVFSSSGSIYGDADVLPIPETAEPRPTNPYSRTKAFGERICSDLCVADPSFSITALRYFNPAGAHSSGHIGEDPTGLLSNLLPILMHVAVGNLAEVSIFGDDFDTPDGTGVRDYVHVMDVAESHLTALEKMAGDDGFNTYNIGRGEGISVLQLIDAVEQATGVSIKRTVKDRGAGDVAALYGDTRLAAEELGFSNYRTLEEICADAWRWQSQNPTGY
jgi:UDP-glucose 4-epimerase